MNFDKQKLIQQFSEMIAVLRGPANKFGRPHKAIEGRKKSGKTRRGAKHTVNAPFRSRNILGMTPAQYRWSHRGNPKKALYKKTKLEKRKWISA